MSLLNNLKTSVKLIGSFLIIAVITAVYLTAARVGRED